MRGLLIVLLQAMALVGLILAAYWPIYAFGLELVVAVVLGNLLWHALRRAWRRTSAQIEREEAEKPEDGGGAS